MGDNMSDLYIYTPDITEIFRGSIDIYTTQIYKAWGQTLTLRHLGRSLNVYLRVRLLTEEIYKCRHIYKSRFF